ncbi:DUF5134 domain-containing protein [Amycolatopsis sp.]|uniref:DUF5134 domain-containing protein n=1 Tax=Amycolatopsis sp. TaxID=37632 RepID=UPI002D808DDC|nr:DUF5134 domain-containing protein [Amycolatopsis sp.]HET6708642.1 DUF5134 domain-containing protein [Amycolatopsis sp.]
MIEATGLRWILTVVFVAAGAFCLYRCVRQGSVTCRIGDVLHAAMCAAMVAMVWPATMGVAGLPQVVLFGFAAAWFAVAVVRGTAHESRWHPGYHAAMMLAMVWMVVAMPRAMVGSGAATTMDMPGMEGMAMALPSAGGGVPADVVLVALTLAIAFCLAGTVFLARAIDGARVAPPSVRTAGWGADALMGLGTSVMLLAML